MSNDKEKISTFHKLDLFLFEKVDLFKKNDLYEKVSVYFGNLDQEKRTLVGRILTLLFWFIPLLIIGIYFYLNIQFKNTLEYKKEIYELSQNIINTSNNLSQLKRNSFAPVALFKNNDLTEKLTNLARMSGSKIEKYKILDFAKEDLLGNIVKTSATIEFMNISLSELTTIILNMEQMEKIKVLSYTFNKNEDTSLSGKMVINHYGQLGENNKI